MKFFRSTLALSLIFCLTFPVTWAQQTPNIHDPNFISDYDLTRFGAFSDLIPEHSLAFQLKNSEALINFLQKTKSNALDSIKNTPGSDFDEIAESVEMFEGLFDEYLNGFSHATVYARIKEGINEQNIQSFKSVIESEDEKAMIQFGQDNLCLMVDLKVNHPDFKTNVIDEAEANKLMLPGFVKIGTREDRLVMQLFDCEAQDREAMKQLGKQSVNLLVTSHGLNQDFTRLVEYGLDQLYSEMNASGESEAVDAIKAFLKPFSELNFVQTFKTTKRSSMALNASENGFMKIQHYQISDPRLARLQQRFLQGKAMMRPMFLSPQTQFAYSTQVKGSDIFHIEKFENLDASYLAGAYASLYGVNGGSPMTVATVGVLATVSVATFSGYQKAAQDAERQSGVRNASTVLKTARAVESIDNFKMSKAEVEKILISEGGYTVPEPKNEKCYYFAYDKETGQEFAVFVGREESSTPAIDGTGSATNDLRFKLPRNLGCGKPEFTDSGLWEKYEVVNLSR